MDSTHFLTDSSTTFNTIYHSLYEQNTKLLNIKDSKSHSVLVSQGKLLEPKGKKFQ